MVSPGPVPAAAEQHAVPFLSCGNVLARGFYHVPPVPARLRGCGRVGGLHTVRSRVCAQRTSLLVRGLLDRAVRTRGLDTLHGVPLWICPERATLRLHELQFRKRGAAGCFLLLAVSGWQGQIPGWQQVRQVHSGVRSCSGCSIVHAVRCWAVLDRSQLCRMRGRAHQQRGIHVLHCMYAWQVPRQQYRVSELPRGSGGAELGPNVVLGVSSGQVRQR